ncbi:hypothetical protein MUCCIDRAFT_104592 [Mucor lusitanicus CBS 277.49]|uniref:RING-type E3 ubiquitin transferase n=1 Tax=Mucor lusitanicus CBS 277.49 TaxID=747725 RepID=A0A168PFA6_MUCCL|nr:hypothetical protein MUCCIDRAFT_104592 [Mucor lusitanicus CBS 277.49]
MARFWTRLFHGKKKKLPVIVFDDYAQSKHLSESYMYGKHLVRVDKLQHAYCHLQQQQQQKSQAPFWRFMDPFIQTWYSELERVCRTSQSALIMLNTQLEEVSNTICFISSPLKNRNRKSLKKAHQFIATCLEEWDSALLIGSTSSSGSCQDYLEKLESRVQHEFGTYSSPKLRQCIRQVCRFKQNLQLYHYYITSQFDMLWSLGSTAMQLEPTTDVPLLQVMKSRWQQKYTHELASYTFLTDAFHALLKKSTPIRQDFTCAVCLCIWHEPTTLQCSHTFCRKCVQHMVCASCHKFRRKTVNRISEGLVHWIKPSPAVYCTCQTFNHLGQTTPLNKEGTCPLCRTLFNPADCVVDEELSKFIALYFPKSSQKEEDEDDDAKDKKTEDQQHVAKKRKSSATTEHSNTRRRSQVSAARFYSKMQRWSNKWNGDHDAANAGIDQMVPPVPRIPLASTQRQSKRVYA